MKLTLSVDEETLRDARRAATAMGKSLDEVVRDYLRSIAKLQGAKTDIAELRRLSATSGGRSRRWRFDRAELHDRT